MLITATFKTALKAMLSNKIRTGLTVLGMVIGITSVIIVFSAGEGINNLIVGQIESFGGSDMFEIEIKVPSTKKGTQSEAQSAANLVQGVSVTTLKLQDMEDVLRLPNVINGYAGLMDQEQISYRNEMRRNTVLGVTPSYIEVDQSEIDYGRFFTEAENNSLARVAVLGYKIKDKLFGDSDPIGKFVKIRKTKFRVIGVMKEKGAVMTFDFDDIVYVPVRSLQKRVMGIDYVQYMMFRVNDPASIDYTADQARYVLRENHNLPQTQTSRASWMDTGKDDFRVVTMAESIEIMGTVTGAITLLLLAIVAISLIVGGVGILNVMYVVVSERTPEIGLRKAVGAKYSDIMWQFLIEAVIITLAGGLIGTVLGIFISFLIALGAGYYGFDWDFSIPVKAFIVALGFSSFFGIAFGLYPARKAAKLDPIQALRNGQ